MGVNKYKLAKEEPIDVLRVDNTMVVQTQVGMAWGGGFSVVGMGRRIRMVGMGKRILCGRCGEEDSVVGMGRILW